MTSASQRSALRSRLISARLELPDSERARLGRAVSAHLTARFPPGSLGLVAGYWPIRGELDLRSYLIATLAAGGRVALPVVVGRRAPLLFRSWTLETQMEAGRWDIEHPASGAPVTPNALLVPLVGFDRAGHRLGYGGGYYDRTLAALAPRPFAIGVGFELGRLESLGPQPYDRPMDVIVTEAGVFESSGKRG